MQENNNDRQEEDFLRNLPVQAEEIGFHREEMVACGKCARTNPPTRLKCLYCGVELELSAAQAARITPVLRKLEIWENGFNLIYQPNPENFVPEIIAKIFASEKIAGMTGLKKEVLQKILEIRKPLPILRCETAKEAEILQKHLRDSGLHTLIISDEKLAPENPPKRLRAMHFREGYIILTIFNTNETLAVSVEDLNLIVSGSIFEKTIESTEARKKGESKILNATETASDESLVDIYAETDANGYRILTKGFDFSCLGAEKGILARGNIKRLERKLQSAAPHARQVDDYLSVRNFLGEIWEIEQRRDSQGLTRQRFGKFDLSSVSSSSNLHQFTKYSRLHWQLLSEGS